MPSDEKSTSSGDDSEMPNIEYQGMRRSIKLQHGE